MRKRGTLLRDGFLTSSSKGAAAELIAVARLMAQGYHVYRCESPSAPFDLVSYRDGRLWRVEVKSLGRRDQSCAPTFSAPANDEWDLLAVVDCDSGWVGLFESVVEAKATVRAQYDAPPLDIVFAHLVGGRLIEGGVCRRGHRLMGNNWGDPGNRCVVCSKAYYYRGYRKISMDEAVAVVAEKYPGLAADALLECPARPLGGLG